MPHAYGGPISQNGGPDGQCVFECVYCATKMCTRKVSTETRDLAPWYEIDSVWREGQWNAACLGGDPGEARKLDKMIGRLDRVLSEFLVTAEDTTIDEADWQTLKHHADDLIGVGNKALELLGRRRW